MNLKKIDKLITSGLRYLCYSGVAFGVFALILGMGKFAKFIIEGESLFDIIFMTFLGIILLVCLLVMGIAAVGLVEVALGDPNSKLKQYIDEEYSETL